MEYLHFYMLTGVFAGLTAGLFGLGGGLVSVPALLILFNLLGYSNAEKVPMAIATSLAVISITAISSAMTHWRQQHVSLPALAPLLPGLIIGSWLGASLVSVIPAFWLLILFATFMLYVALRMWSGANDAGGQQPINSRRLWPWGFAIGSSSALMGVGGGTFTVPLLRNRGFELTQAIGTSAACGLPIAWSSTLAFVLLGRLQGMDALGYVHGSAFVGLVITSPLFAFIGATLVKRLNKALLQQLFALLMVLIAVRMFWFAFGD